MNIAYSSSWLIQRFLESVCNIHANFTVHLHAHDHEFEAIMLSMKAAEHQRKNPLQLSMIFQANLPDFFKDHDLMDGVEKKSAEAAVEAAIDTYNSHGPVAIQPRWQIRGEERQSVRNLALAVHPVVKGLMVVGLKCHKHRVGREDLLHALHAYFEAWLNGLSCHTAQNG